MHNGAEKVHGPPSALSREDEEEFARLFQDSFRVLWYIAAGVVGNAATAEDVVQESALIGLRKFSQFQSPAKARSMAHDASAKVDGMSAFTVWMGRIVHYVALNQYRKDRRRAAVSLSTQPQSAGISILDRARGRMVKLTQRGQLADDQQAFDDRMMRTLEQLGDDARACLLLRTLEDLEYRQIAQLLDIPQGTAMSHVHRARQLLRKQLADMMPPPSPSQGVTP